MNLNKSLATARRQICTIEGAVRYVTEKGHIRTSEPEKWEKVVYKVYVKKGVQYVEKEGKQISPKKEVKEKKGKSVSKLSATADEDTTGDIQ